MCFYRSLRPLYVFCFHDFISFGHVEFVKQPISITSEYSLLKTGLDKSSKKSYFRDHFQFLVVYFFLINLSNKFCLFFKSNRDLICFICVYLYMYVVCVCVCVSVYAVCVCC